MGKKIDATGWKMWEHGVPDSRLTVIKEYGRNKYGECLWECECSCGSGKKVIARIRDLKSGNTKSCGCIVKEKTSQMFTKHGDSNSRLYKVWKSMIKRTINPKDENYKYYGEKGIKVCDEWLNYINFKNWAIKEGYDANAPYGEYTLERKEVKGDYCPENCKWATMKEQANNKTNSVFVTFNNETHTYAEWDNILGFNRGTTESRIKILGWEVERALTTKLIHGKHIKCEDKIFPSIKKCAEYYHINYSTMKSWLNNNNPMPQEWENKGLSYFKEE